MVAGFHLWLDDAGRVVDAGDSAGGLACISLQHLWRLVGGEAADGKRQQKKHEAERAAVAGHHAMHLILNVHHGYPPSLLRLDSRLHQSWAPALKKEKDCMPLKLFPSKDTWRLSRLTKKLWPTWSERSCAGSLTLN